MSSYITASLINIYFLPLLKTLHGLDYCKPSSITYITFLKLLDNLVESGTSRDYMAEKVFGLSDSSGLASEGVKAQLRKTCSPLVAKRILSSCEDKDYHTQKGNWYTKGTLWKID